MRKVSRYKKTPEAMEARDAVLRFLKKYNLSPLKDHSKHPIYGEEFTKLMVKLRKERDKLTLEKYRDINQIKNRMKSKKKLKEVKATEKADLVVAKAAAEKVKKSKKAKKEETPKTKKPVTKYDYPLIDGREMTSEEKKKYRVEQRKKAANTGTESKATKEPNKKAKPSKEKKSVKVKAPAAPKEEVTSKVKKAKKVKKEED